MTFTINSQHVSCLQNFNPRKSSYGMDIFTWSECDNSTITVKGPTKISFMILFSLALIQKVHLQEKIFRCYFSKKITRKPIFFANVFLTIYFKCIFS